MSKSSRPSGSAWRGSRSSCRPPRAGFLADRDAQEMVAFNLLMAFQDSLDLAARLIADRGWQLPATAREHFDILTANSVLEVSTAEAMGRCAGLRNLVAHAYGVLDLGRLYDELPAGTAALRAFCIELETFDACSGLRRSPIPELVDHLFRPGRSLEVSRDSRVPAGAWAGTNHLGKFGAGVIWLLRNR